MSRRSLHSSLALLALVALLTAPTGCAGQKGAAAESLGTQAGPAGPYPPPMADGPGDASMPASGGAYAPDVAEAEAAPAYAKSRGRDDRAAQHSPDPSPGLGTSYGETRHSGVDYVGFRRASSHPDAVLSLWYDDDRGIRQRIDARGQAARSSAWASTQDGELHITVVDESQRPFDAYTVAGRRYVVGQVGARYLVGIENHGGDRVEAVTSVDGLDVIDGSDASHEHRGYVLEPYTSTMIEGWRTSESTVATFRFADLRDSYAAQTGRARNVGVIGVAFFREEHRRPWREIDRRDTANPFPGN